MYSFPLMFFIKDVAVSERIVEYSYDTHYVKDIKVSEEVAKEVRDAINQIESVTWEPYTAQAVGQYVYMNMGFAERLEAVPTQSKTSCASWSSLFKIFRIYIESYI